MINIKINRPINYSLLAGYAVALAVFLFSLKFLARALLSIGTSKKLWTVGTLVQPSLLIFVYQTGICGYNGIW